MFENSLMEALNGANQSESIGVRKAATLAKQALLDRRDVLDMNASINANTEISSELKSAAKRHELTKNMEKSRALDAVIASALEDIARGTPPIPQAETAGAATVDSELRTYVRNLPADKRTVDKLSPASQLALARGPAELSGLSENEHARLTDTVRRRLYPDQMAARDADLRVIEAVKVAQAAHKQTARSTFGTAIETHATVINAA